MISTALTPDDYVRELNEEEAKIINRLRETIKKSMDPQFEEIMNYGMISYVVPHKLYPLGYHCKPEDPLPFAGLAKQKNFYAVYHMGLYEDQSLIDKFKEDYKSLYGKKLDMGKSCMRFKNEGQIPYELISELFKKISVAQYIKNYEKHDPRKKQK